MKPGDDIAAGDLDQIIDIEGVTNPDSDEPTYGTIASNVRAAKRSVRGRELLEAGRDMTEQWAIFTLRYRSGITTRMRVVHGAETWGIEGVDDVNGSQRKLELTCRRVR